MTPLFTEGKPPQMIEMIKSLAPLKRLGEPEDIAPLVAFLAGEEARWVNGQNIMCNGVCCVPCVYGKSVTDNFFPGICGIGHSYAYRSSINVKYRPLVQSTAMQRN